MFIQLSDLSDAIPSAARINIERLFSVPVHEKYTDNS